MGSRVADAPVRSTAVAVSKERREVDLAIMVMELCKCGPNERREVKTTDFCGRRADVHEERVKGRSWLPFVPRKDKKQQDLLSEKGASNAGARASARRPGFFWQAGRLAWTDQGRRRRKCTTRANPISSANEAQLERRRKRRRQACARLGRENWRAEILTFLTLHQLVFAALGWLVLERWSCRNQELRLKIILLFYLCCHQVSSPGCNQLRTSLAQQHEQHVRLINDLIKQK